MPRMLTFAIEQSTPRASVALLRDTATLAARAWEEQRFRNQHVFEELPALFKEAGIAPGEVDLFAAGLGPGAFAGLRIALSVAQAAALPGGKPVRGVSSGEALAWSLRDRLPGQRVTVVGDARRGRLWWARLRIDSNAVAVEQDYRLGDADELARTLDADTAVVTAEWERLGETLQALTGAHGARLLPGAHAPTAAAVAELAFRRSADGSGTPPKGPIYLHPPVFIEPRFPAKAASQGSENA